MLGWIDTSGSSGRFESGTASRRRTSLVFEVRHALNSVVEGELDEVGPLETLAVLSLRSIGTRHDHPAPEGLSAP